MATVQILAFITLDGYLARRSTFPDLWEHPEKYGITRIREAALSCLGPDVSFMSLTEWKQGHSGVYLAEAALEKLPFTDSLLRFQGEGFRLFEGCPGFSLWELAGMRSFDRDVCRLHYRRVAGG